MAHCIAARLVQDTETKLLRYQACKTTATVLIEDRYPLCRLHTGLLIESGYLQCIGEHEVRFTATHPEPLMFRAERIPRDYPDFQGFTRRVTCPQCHGAGVYYNARDEQDIGPLGYLGSYCEPCGGSGFITRSESP